MAAPDGGCPEFHATLAPDEVEQWAEGTLREHGWHVDDHDAYYCPAHNPTDAGTPVALIRSEYRPLGASGWEARLPDGFASSTHEFGIEIRQQHWLTASDPERGRDVVVEEKDGTRWHRTDDGDHDGAANWEKVGVSYFEPESWTKVAGNYGPVRVVSVGG